MRISDWSSDVCSSDLLETALERARRDAAIKQLARLAFGDRRLAAAHGQHILLRGDVDLVRLEAGQRHRAPVIIVGNLLDFGPRLIVGGRPPGFEELRSTVALHRGTGWEEGRVGEGVVRPGND